MNTLDFQIIIACEAAQKIILQKACPQAIFEPLPGYGIQLGGSAQATRMQLLLQSPRLLRSMVSENNAVRRLIKKYDPLLILSDNRYGFRSTHCRSVLLTHQLSIQTGFGKHADRFIDRVNRQLIGFFDECWVPDTATHEKMAGDLSTPSSPLPIPVRYLGGLSRLSPCAAPIRKKAQVVILLSGPEPQRSILEKKILAQASGLKQQVLLIRGLPQGNGSIQSTDKLAVIDFMDSEALQPCLCEANLIICRSGYSTLMDLLRIRAKAVLVPTPGQAEQEYLAQHFENNHWAMAMNQESFDMQIAMERAMTFPFAHPEIAFDDHKIAINDFLGS